MARQLICLDCCNLHLAGAVARCFVDEDSIAWTWELMHAVNWQNLRGIWQYVHRTPLYNKCTCSHEICCYNELLLLQSSNVWPLMCLSFSIQVLSETTAVSQSILSHDAYKKVLMSCSGLDCKICSANSCFDLNILTNLFCHICSMSSSLAVYC